MFIKMKSVIQDYKSMINDSGGDISRKEAIDSLVKQYDLNKKEKKYLKERTK